MNKFSRATIPRLGVVDLLILFASILLGVWVAGMDPERLESALGLGSNEAGRNLPRRLPPSRLLLLSTDRISTIVLTFATLGCAFATFRHRESRSQLAMRRIGHLTIAITAAFLALSLANEYVLRRFEILQFGYRHNPFRYLWGDLAEETSRGIAALWAILALGRCWRTEPCWADRLGRAFGMMWIGHMILKEWSKFISIP